MHSRRAIAFAPRFQFFDPVAQHGCKLPSCLRCLSLMKVAKRWRIDRFCHVIDIHYPSIFMSRGFQCSSPGCRCEFLATNPVYMSTLSLDIQRLVPKKTKRSFVSRRLIDELSQDLYRSNNANEYITMISDQICRGY